MEENKQRWSKPPDDWLKINTDGAFLPKLSEGGWGFVIRDEMGDVILAGAGKLPRVRDAFQSEVNAGIRGVRAAIDNGISKVILETDSLLLKQALENDSYRLSEAGGSIYELKSLVAGNFMNFQCNFAPRSCNQVAHALAALGCSCPQDGDLVWDGYTSTCRGPCGQRLS